MAAKIEIKKKVASQWFKFLQSKICEEFEQIEKERSKRTKSAFVIKNWTKSKTLNNGGGTFAMIKNGSVFDSVGVNFSEVSGKFEKKFRSQILGADKNPNYWASGISVVAHMKNPRSGYFLVVTKVVLLSYYTVS